LGWLNLNKPEPFLPHKKIFYFPYTSTAFIYCNLSLLLLQSDATHDDHDLLNIEDFKPYMIDTRTIYDDDIQRARRDDNILQNHVTLFIHNPSILYRSSDRRKVAIPATRLNNKRDSC
jgi:hypothetical protein